MSEIITIPHMYKPYDHQIELFAARDKGIKHLLTRWHRRCFVGTTPIAMSNGSWKNIKDVVVGDEVLSYNKGKIEPKKVLKVFNNGEQEVIEYNDLVCTPNHRVLTTSGTYKEIQETDHLINAGILKFNSIHNPDLAEVLGLLLTDGYVTKNQTPKFTNTNIKLLERFDFLVQKVFNNVKTNWYKKGNGFDVVCTQKQKTNYHPIRYYFKTSNTLPEIVWQFDFDSTLAFISGVISGDGSIYYKETTTPRGFKSLTGQVVIEAGVSKDLAEDYKKLLLKFGIRTKIKKDSRSNNWRVFIYSLKSLHQLNGIKISHKDKKDKFEFVLKNTKPYKQFKQERKKIGKSYLAETYDITVEDNHNYIANGYIVHNCGKDLSFWNLVIREAIKRKGIYYYVFPQLKQGKKALFEGMTNDGITFMDYIPEQLRDGQPNATELKVRLSNGSLIQIIGTDKYDKVRGTNPVGVVYSEFAYQNPGCRETIRPILLGNGGWEALNSTPNGKNHMYMLETKAQAKTNDDTKIDDRWFISVKTIDETYRHDGSPIFTQEMLQSERDEGYSEEFLQQEYYVSYNANAQGYYYLAQMNRAREEGRIGNFPWNPDQPVYTYWDIGVGDSTAIWFLQWQDGVPVLIDFYTSFSAGIDHYASVLLNGQRARYAYKMHLFPHDMSNTEFGTGLTRYEMAYDYFGTDKVDIGPKLGFDDGIQATRILLNKCKFNEDENTDPGIKAIENYQREYNDERKEFSPRPKHDWASHPSDALRYCAVALEKPKEKQYIAKRLREYRRQYGKASWKLA